MDTFKLDTEDIAMSSSDTTVDVPVRINAVCAKCHAHLAVDGEWVAPTYGDDGHIRVLIHPCNVCLAELLTKYKERYLADHFEKQAAIYKRTVKEN